MKYRKLLVVVEAFKWTGDIQKAPIWIVGAIERRDIRCNDEMTSFDTIKIKTLEGNHIARLGDYIIKGVHGEIYSCKPEIFEKTYELAE